MKNFPRRQFVHTAIYFQQMGLSDEITIEAGFKNIGGTRSHPSIDGYIDILVPKLDGHYWSFGLKISFEGKDLPLEILEDIHLNQLLGHLVASGLVYNTEYAKRIMAIHFRDTLENALKYVWEKESQG